MSLHANPKYNPPEMRGLLIGHGMKADTPDMLADAFRLGWAAAKGITKVTRCENCNCEFGDADCNRINICGTQ